jgi:hypothetical protein
MIVPHPVFDHGRIVEDGNHAALMQLKASIYRRLVERQVPTGAGVGPRTRGRPDFRR